MTQMYCRGLRSNCSWSAFAGLLPVMKIGSCSRLSPKYTTARCWYSTKSLVVAPQRKVRPEVQASIDKKNLILSVLRSTATKREAKQYISRYMPVANQPQGQTLRVSVIKLRQPESIPKEHMLNIGRTLSQLTKLGVSPVIVLDAESERTEFMGNEKVHFRDLLIKIESRARAIASDIESSSTRLRVRPVENLFDIKTLRSTAGLKVPAVENLLRPLVRGIVPVVIPLAYDHNTGEEKLITANDAVSAVVEALGRSKNPEGEASDLPLSSVEKVIFIDPLGGTPSIERGGSTATASHVFVNLEMEFPEISSELLRTNYLPRDAQQVHIANLHGMRNALATLPETSSGIITTPQTAGLTSSRNPIIYNVLTDRPVVSASLPVATKRTPILNTTIYRKGMPVKMLYSESGIDIVKEDKLGNIDLFKLVELINDSFRKTLDVDHYLKRVNGKLAGIIIAGDYEGAAIVTWEDSVTSKAPSARVAYLDKFAVRSSSQGGSGVADVVFKSMVARMFPQEVLWRSRADNPVNKWYFERSKGTMKVPGTHWTMFWNGTHSREDENIDDYLHICTTIEPSLR